MPDIVPTVPTVPTTPTVSSPQQQQKPAQTQTPQKPQQLFRNVYQRTLQAGSLVTFQYTFWRHDPYPLVLCGGLWASGKMVGVNLHYLTFKYIKFLINQFCGKNFNYHYIKSNQFIKNSFRSYKREGVRNVRMLDCQFLLSMMGQVRSLSPTEVEAMRQHIRGQLQEKMNLNVQDIQDYTKVISTQLGGTTTRDDGRRNPIL